MDIHTYGGVYIYDIVKVKSRKIRKIRLVCSKD